MRLLAIGFVCIGGAVLGWDTAAATRHLAAAAVKESAAVIMPHSSTLVVVPVRSRISSGDRQAQELGRLTARNRRLEALVRVLQNREAERQP